jgi:deoxyribonuclease V
MPDLIFCLRQLLAQLPAGRVTTCGDLAEALGSKIAATWVGYYSLHHKHDAECPCHRIVRAGGMLGPFITTTEEKTQRLAEEGVVAQDGTVALERFGFHDFSSDRPLEKLRQIQEDIQARIVLRPRRRIPKYIGGVDVAYPNAEEGVAAYALVETATGRLEWSTTVRRRVVFPYISTYLGFREIPILLDLLDEVREAGRMAEVLMVDGSGILHHRHAGVASHLGVVASLPTIGVTKKLLCGQVDINEMKPGESRPVWEKRGQVQFVRSTRRAVPANCTCPLFSQIGISLRPTAGSARPIFISPGHRVDLPFCEQLVRRFLTGRRLPEPIYWADRLSKRKVTL